MPIEEDIEKVLKDTNPTAQAVEALIKIEDTGEKKLTSDVELKTDLSDNEVRSHAALAVLNNLLESDAKKFVSKCVLGDLLMIKERKALSKDRKSRQEIVEIARTPEQNLMGMPMPMMPMDNKKDGFLKRLTTPKK